MKKYQLANKDGCYFDSIETTSYKKARDYFKSKYEGSFVIVFENERKKVRL